MTDHQKNLVLSVVKHYMDMDLRAKLIREVPDAYNALVGSNVVKVVHQDGRVAR